MARNNYGTTWWGQQWLNALCGIDYANRIPRGKTYANTGKVYNFSIDTVKGLIKARVKGNYDPFYSVKIKVGRVERSEVTKFIDAIASSPLILSKLATRELDPAVAELADKFGINIFPKSWRDFDLDCSCPDFAIPCKHIASVIYIISKEIDANPFILFELHGIDIIASLKERGFTFDEAVESTLPTWTSFIQMDIENEESSMEALKALSYTNIENFENGVLKLLSDVPPGFTQGSLKTLCSNVLTKAVKLAKAIMTSKEDRDLVLLPDCDSENPFIRINSFGESFIKDLQLTVYPSTGSGKTLVYALSDSDDSSYENKRPFYHFFSAATNAKDLESQSIELEAFYNLWLIALKLIEKKAVMPQMYECIEGVYRIRWIPAVVSSKIRDLVLETGRCMQTMPRRYLHIDRVDDFTLDAYQTGLIALSIFIESFIKDAYRGIRHEDDAFEIKALFKGELIDVDDTPSSEGIKLRLEAWLQPLFIKDLAVSPVIVLTDLLDKKSRALRDDLILKSQKLDRYLNIDAVQERNIYDSYSGIYNPVIDTAADVQSDIAFNDSWHEGIQERADIVIDIGFKTDRADGSKGFVHLRSILDEEYYSDIRFECLRTIAKLGSIAPNLSEVLKSSDYQCLVEMEDLAYLLSDAMPALKMLGIELIIPKSLKALLKPATTLHLDVPEFNIEKNSMLNLADLLSFDFTLSAGDYELDEDEFKALLNTKYKVVRYRENFISIDPKEFVKLKKRFESNAPSPKPIELIAAALTGEYEGSKVKLTESMQQAIGEIFKEKESSVPQSLNADLREYQKRGFSWLYKNTQAAIGSIIADDMGLGKTLQVIAALDKMREAGGLDDKKVLVVVPSSLLVNWQREIHKFAPELTYSVFYGTKKQLDLTTHIILTTYGVMARSADKELSKVNFRVCIIDEAQAIKNSKTENFKKIKKIKADCRIAMSGTPVENRLNEYWSIMDFVNPGLLGSETDFKNDYAKPIEKHRDAAAVEKFKRVTAPFVMRRLKTDKSIIDDLPEKISTNQYCTLQKGQLALYQSKVNSALSRLENNETNRLSLVLEMITALKQICNCPETFELEGKDFNAGNIDPGNSGKAENLFELLDELVDAGKKSIIFTQFTKMGEILRQWCKDRYSMEVDFYHGSLSQKDRSHIVDSFQTDRSKKILILSLRAAGTGLNLTAASAVIHYDLWWNPSVENQATDRAYRIGQKNNVNVYRLICANTFEEKIDEIIQSKKELAELTVSTGENWIGDLSNRQLKDLFSVN